MTDLSENPTEPSHDSIHFGESLKQERLRQGLSLDVISKGTGINISNLLALEDGARRKLPADVFNRGFIKIYSKYLQIDPGESLDRYEKDWGFTNGIDGATVYLTGGAMAEPASILKDRQALTFIGIVVLVAAIFLAFQFFPPNWSRNNHPTLTKDSSDQEAEHETKQVFSRSTTKLQDVALPETLLDKGVEETRPAISDATQKTMNYTLIATFSERTWLKIAIDHNSPAEYTFRSNEKHTWKATETFHILIGNAGGVTLFLDGKKIELNRGSGQVLSLTLP